MFTDETGCQERGTTSHIIKLNSSFQGQILSFTNIWTKNTRMCSCQHFVACRMQPLSQVLCLWNSVGFCRLNEHHRDILRCPSFGSPVEGSSGSKRVCEDHESGIVQHQHIIIWYLEFNQLWCSLKTTKGSGNPVDSREIKVKCGLKNTCFLFLPEAEKNRFLFQFLVYIFNLWRKAFCLFFLGNSLSNLINFPSDKARSLF